MNKENYILQVSRHLQCENARKKEITDQLYSDIESALEQGEEWEDIRARLGTPEEMAAELNENLTGDVSPAVPSPVSRKTIGIAAGIVLLLCLTLISVGIVYQNRQTDSHPTASPSETNPEWPVTDEDAIAIASSVLENYNKKNDAGILELCNDNMRLKMTPKTFREIRENYLKNAGSYQCTENTSVTHTKELDIPYTIVQLITRYENRQVIFTITLDKDKRLAGFYIR